MSGGHHPPGAWWTSFFDDTYADLGFIARDGPDADRLAETVRRVLDLKPGMRVFDQCCGIGRIAIPLAQRDIEVEGVDLAQSYVERARAEAARAGVPATFACADAFAYVAQRPCDAAINVYTSFGYSDDDATNARMLSRAIESLKPGGRLLLERINPCWVVAFGLMASGRRVPSLAGETVILDEPVADWSRGMIASTWTLIHPDGHRETRSFETRMLFPHELVAMARAAGFVDVEVRGGDGDPFDRHGRRLILLARRP